MLTPDVALDNSYLLASVGKEAFYLFVITIVKRDHIVVKSPCCLQFLTPEVTFPYFDPQYFAVTRYAEAMMCSAVRL